MLQQIRDRAHGWTIKVIVGLIALTFAFFGVESIVGAFNNNSNDAATVNGEKISEARLQTQLQRAVRSGQVPPDQQREARSGILDQMITRTLLQQYADKGGLSFSSQQMDQLIVGRREFQDSQGHFSSDLFQQRLASAGYTPSSFRRQLQGDMVIRQLQQGLAAGSFLLPREQQRLNALVNQTRSFRYATLDGADVDPAEISDQQLQDWYNAHQSAYQRPEQVKLNYVILDRGDMADQIQVGDQKLRELYQQRRSSAPRQVSDIVVSYGNQRSEDQARQRMQKIQSKLAEGADFAELARQYSDDASSASNGGDLGVVTEGIFGKQFDRTVASLDKGQTAQPIELDNALHLIRVTGIDIPSFDSMRDELADEARTNAVASKFDDKAQQLRDQSFSAEDLRSVAQSLNLALQHSDWLARDTSDKLFSQPGIMQAAFSEDVLKNGYNSNVIELGDDRRMVVRVVDHRPATTLPLDEVDGQVRQAVAQHQRQQQLDRRAAQLVEQLRNGEATSLDWRQADNVTRQSHDGIAQATVDAVFAMPKPGQQQSTFAHVAKDGRQIVLALDNVGQAAGNQENSRIQSNLKRLEIQTAINGLTSTLRDEADIQRR